MPDDILKGRLNCPPHGDGSLTAPLHSYTNIREKRQRAWSFHCRKKSEPAVSITCVLRHKQARIVRSPQQPSAPIVDEVKSTMQRSTHVTKTSITSSEPRSMLVITQEQLLRKQRPGSTYIRYCECSRLPGVSRCSCLQEKSSQHIHTAGDWTVDFSERMLMVTRSELPVCLP